MKASSIVRGPGSARTMIVSRMMTTMRAISSRISGRNGIERTGGVMTSPFQDHRFNPATDSFEFAHQCTGKYEKDILADDGAAQLARDAAILWLLALKRQRFAKF